MVKRQMFSKIQKLRMQGFSMEAIALELGINRKTVSNYVQMSPEEYIAYEMESRSRKRIPSEYKEKIIEIYRNNGFKRLNMTGVYDYLEEIVGKLAFTDRTLRNYINSLIQNGELKISETIRMYEKVAPLPFGKQMQMDFGQYKFKSGLKVYIFATLLSASRYKYVSFQDRPFRGKDIIDHLINCFEYFGGQPEELVIDQDAALVASENHGDILYTKEFSHFIEEMNLKMYVCRKADPESKGKVENLVGYVKHNFLDIRDYSEIEELCKSGLLWLDRRANGSISAATGLIPANVITEERKFLHPIRNSIFKINSIVKDERIVSQQSFISYQNSLYSVPTGYRNQKVEVAVILDILYIYSLDNVLLAEHEITSIYREKVIKREHFREKEKKLSDLKEDIPRLFELPLWKEFVLMNFRTFPRYTRDQCILAKKYFNKDTNENLLLQALLFCNENKTFSFKNLFDSYNYFFNEDKADQVGTKKEVKSFENKTLKIDVSLRELQEYTSHILGEAV